MINLEEDTWDILLERIREKKCTPFLGAGACAGALPLSGELASDLAAASQYPLADRNDLLRVTQFIAVKSDPRRAKTMVVDRLKKAAPPDFTVADEPHAVLASLNLPIYLTTNYDDFMLRALKAEEKDARRDVCRWNSRARKTTAENELPPQPTPAAPLVFHLHGYDKEPDSLVLTEDDYLKFMINFARDAALLPTTVQDAIAASTLLFIGYRLADWNFRMLFQMLRPDPDYISIAVLRPPAENEPSPKEAQQYLEKYYGALNLKMFWGTAREFAAELRRRWTERRASKTG